MYRGIKGTYVYACNPRLREYFKKHIPVFKAAMPFRILRNEDVKPYVNALPLVDIQVAAGNFSELQLHSDCDWVEPPFNIAAKPGYFICKVVGESMNKVIPNGSYCLFREDDGGSRNGKIVLVESTSIRDAEFGSGYTVKLYESTKEITEDGWRHASIRLKPQSHLEGYKDIELTEDDMQTLRVRGIFEKVIG
jgi:hypothetical protein